MREQHAVAVIHSNNARYNQKSTNLKLHKNILAFLKKNCFYYGISCCCMVAVHIYDLTFQK